MKKSKIILYVVSIFLYSPSLFSQNEKSNEFNVGTAISLADKRYDFLKGNSSQEWVKNDNSIFEHDIFLNYNKELINKKRYQLFAGLGYLLNINLIKLRIQNEEFTKKGRDANLILLFNDTYYKHNIYIPIELRYKLKSSQKFTTNILFSSIADYTFYKTVKPESRRTLSIFKSELSDIEFYSGINFTSQNISYKLDFRFINLQFKDNALANNGKEVDFYNPLKIRFSIGKRF
jgi:hypothetical protein